MARKKSFDVQEYLSMQSPSGEPRPLSQFTALLRALKVKKKPDYQCIHIAGTNGKGSTAAVLASILQASGYRTGLFTSPALIAVNERIVIDGEPVADDVLSAAAERVAAAEKKAGQSTGGFDRMTAAALLIFQEVGLDFVVLETGMGGRFDATTAMPAQISMITQIGFDHAEVLGNTLRKIAREKAGIIKKGQQCCILHPQPPEVMDVLVRRCEMTGVRPVFVDRGSIRGRRIDKLWQQIDEDNGEGVVWQYQTSLRGAFQWVNVVAAARCARELKLDAIAVAEGVRRARWNGRMEQFNGPVPVLLDGAHNPDGMRALADALQEWYPKQSVVWIGSIREGKEYQPMIDDLKDRVEVFIPIAMGDGYILSAELANYARSIGVPAQEGSEMAVAFEEAKKFCDSMEEKFPLILAAGSLRFVGAMRALLMDDPDYYPALDEIDMQNME